VTASSGAGSNGGPAPARSLSAFATARLAGPVLILALVSAAPRPLTSERTYAEGAPPGFSGGFGEESCHACHFHADLNSGPGRVTIAGLPDRYAAGARYPLTITLAQARMRLGGFQLTARFTQGGAQAGTLAPGPDEQERVGIELQAGVQYAGHRRSGAELVAPDMARWLLVWTAPLTGGPVVLHVALNAADADDSVRGDFVYATAAETAPAR
jgi:hypothetical protein